MFKRKKNFNSGASHIRLESICFVCGEEVKDTDDFEWHGYDGDRIHTKCKPHLQQKYDQINNMSNEDFKKYMRGE